MQAILAVLIIYFYGVGHPPVVKAVEVPSIEACRTVLTIAKNEAIKLPDVRDAQGGCIAVDVPEPRNKT